MNALISNAPTNVAAVVVCLFVFVVAVVLALVFVHAWGIFIFIFFKPEFIRAQLPWNVVACVAFAGAEGLMLSPKTDVRWVRDAQVVVLKVHESHGKAYRIKVSTNDRHVRRKEGK
jgi:hypothetical protein